MLPEGVTVRHPDKLFIGGAWVAASSGRAIEIVSPNSETVVGAVAEADERDMDAAVAAAREAFDRGPWPRMAPAERAALVARMAEVLRAREPELAKAWTAQVGGLASVAPGMMAGATMTAAGVAAMASGFEFAKRVPSQMVHTAIIAREPVGVVAAIAPWNGPYMIMISKVANALVAGCTVIMKPSPETPLEAYIIAEAAEAAGIPPGVVNLVCGHRDASDHLVCNHGVDKVSFTGSTVAGRRIGAVCGERLARCTLELGGKSAAIVRDDYAIADAATLLASTITMMSGQICAMLSRAIVPRARHDELAEAIAVEMRRVRIGHSDDPHTQLAPVAMQRQLERIEGYIADGKATADLVTGGGRPAHLNRGYFIEPTLFANVRNDSRIAQEEIFGPVLSLIPAEDEEDAIRIANDSNYGLSGSVFTHDADAAYRIARRMRTGGVGQNGMRMDFGLPFGGFKQSGIGREGGEEGLMGYLETKTILLDATPAEARMMNRTELYGVLDAYLAALAARNPARVDWAPDVRTSENNVMLAVGDGLWGTITAIGGYQLRFADPAGGQVGYFGTVTETHEESAFTLRLKVDHRGKVVEAETIVVRQSDSGIKFENQRFWDKPILNANVATPMARDAMVALSDGYFSTLQLNDGTLHTKFHPDCERVENGVQTTHNPEFAKIVPVSALGCEEQFRMGNYRYDDRLRARRFPLIDEERGLVLAYAFIDHEGRLGEYQLTDGRTVTSPLRRPHSFYLAELFKIEDGMLRQIEANFITVPYHMPSPWDA